MICYVRKGNNCIVINHPDIHQTNHWSYVALVQQECSKTLNYSCLLPYKNGRVTKWLCGGLQIRIRGFKSLPALFHQREG